MSKDLHSELADEASAWAAENGESPAADESSSGPGAEARSPQQTEEPPAAQPVSSSSSERKTDDQVEDDDDVELLEPEEVAELAITLLDIGMTNYFGEHMALKPQQQQRLQRVGTKVAKKWMPEVEGAVEPEYVLAAALLMTYVPKYMAGPGPKPATTASGGGSSAGSPPPTTTTSATVDGRNVTAEVIS